LNYILLHSFGNNSFSPKVYKFKPIRCNFQVHELEIAFSVQKMKAIKAHSALLLHTLQQCVAWILSCGRKREQVQEICMFVC